MIRLNLNSTGPRWLDLSSGVRVLVAPLTSVVVGAAASDQRIMDLPEDCSAQERSVAMAKAIGSRVITEWEGVGDDEGNPIAVSDASVDALMDFYPCFETFQVAYVASAMQVHQEKKGSALSPNGTSAGARGTAKRAPRAAKPARKSKTVR